MSQQKTNSVRIIYDGFAKRFVVVANSVGVYYGSREECEIILEAFVRVGFTDTTANEIRSDSHRGYCEMNLQSHPDL